MLVAYPLGPPRAVVSLFSGVPGLSLRCVCPAFEGQPALLNGPTRYIRARCIRFLLTENLDPGVFAYVCKCDIKYDCMTLDKLYHMVQHVMGLRVALSYVKTE